MLLSTSVLLESHTRMQSLLASIRPSTISLCTAPALARSARSYAHSSYGNKQSGFDGSSKSNPRADAEHPGPKAPADKTTSQSSGSNASNDQNQKSPSNGGKPVIHQPGQPDEHMNAEVEAHNKEMENRSDRSVNQLSENDNKVDKAFWKGPSPCYRCIWVLSHRPIHMTSASRVELELLC